MSTAFNISEGEGEETNRGIYGKSLAMWLASQLQVSEEDVIAEDFGWCVPVKSSPHRLCVACSSEDDRKDRWRVLVFAEGGFVARLLGRDTRAAEVESLLSRIKQIFAAKAGVSAMTERRASHPTSRWFQLAQAKHLCSAHSVGVGAEKIEGNGMTHSTFIVLYRWRLRPGAEKSFISAWSRVTELLRNERGSLGSRLHQGSDGSWYSYAQWPSARAREEAFALGPVDARAGAEMEAAILESFPEILLEPISDFLLLPGSSTWQRHT